MKLAPLPVDDLLEPIALHLAAGPNLVIEAAPGAGKTTRVPPALLRFGEVVVLEPRRIAARMAARRVAFELGERPGGTVGYQVRFEEQASAATRLRFVTEGVLNRRMLSDPELAGISTVVLDEFHERHLEGDTALALVRRLQQTRRPDLRIVVMSATLDGESVAQYLDGCPRVTSAGRLHPIDVRYTPVSADPLEEQVRAAVVRLLDWPGDILVFLPGAAEIRRAAQALEGDARRANLLISPLHGDLSPEEQDRAVNPAGQRKVILATNVAESSITVEGVTAVIDSGLARVARDSPHTGLPSVEITRISKASATQRAGRAGRTAPGRVIRLYPEEDFVRRPERDQPEILRRELSSLTLDLLSLGAHPAELPWFDAPPAAAFESAAGLLGALGAVAGDRVTPRGRSMAKLPLHPRLAALVAAADARGAGHAGCSAAAVLSAGERLASGRASHTGPSDVLALMDRDPSPAARRTFDQIRRAARPAPDRAGDDAVRLAILEAFPDRVARRRAGSELLLASGGGATLADSSVVRDATLMVCVDIEERRDRGQPLVRLASAIEPEWLLDLFPDRVTDRSGVEWNRQAERVEAVSALLFDGLVIEESRSGAVDAEMAARLLAEKALEAGLDRFAGEGETDTIEARWLFAAAHTDLPQPDWRAALESLCYGVKSFAELERAARDGGLGAALLATLPAEQRRRLDQFAPERIELPSGRKARIQYIRDQPPSVASRLQDFFGLTQTPTVAAGRVPLVVHLLAPNQRPVQMTSDLAGFWTRLYPQVRKELSRRYPRHPWPENPV